MEEKGTLFNILIREKPHKLLIKLKSFKESLERNKKNSCSAIIRGIATHSHGLKILRKLENVGLVTFEKKSKNNIVKLTEKGDKIVDHLKKIEELLE